MKQELLGKAKQKQYRHWIIVFEEEPLYKEHTLQEGLSFPIPFEKHQYPYVGALDLNGMSISYAQTKDIELYLEIKRLYENRTDYPKVIKRSQYLLAHFLTRFFVVMRSFSFFGQWINCLVIKKKTAKIL